MYPISVSETARGMVLKHIKMGFIFVYFYLGFLLLLFFRVCFFFFKLKQLLTRRLLYLPDRINCLHTGLFYAFLHSLMVY